MHRTIAFLLISVATAASAQQPVRIESFGLPSNFRDLPLAALGKLTLDCLGTVGPTLYSTRGGKLERTFDSCTQDATALEEIDELLGAQDSNQGIIDGLAPHYVTRWDAFVRRFPARTIRQCPTWTLQNVIDAPTDESIARMRVLARPGKESYRYTVSAPQCNGNAQCSVVLATACAGGFGPTFLVESDILRGRVEVDPVWWLTRKTRFPTGKRLPNEWCSNVSADPDVPYKAFGTIEMAGQPCCEFLDGKAYLDRVFVPIDCGGGWYCVTYCTLPPQ
jgi:hypothetical protein